MSRPDSRSKIPDLLASETGIARERFKPLDRRPRLEKLENLIREKGVDAMLMSLPANIYYFSGFRCVVPEDREAFAVVGPDGRRDFITRKLYFGQAPEGFAAIDIATEFEGYLNQLKANGVNKLGIEKPNLSVEELEILEAAGYRREDGTLVGIDLKEPRRYKTEEEIDRIREACSLGDKTFRYMLESGCIREGMTEEQLRDILEDHMRSQGITTTSFETIVSFGKNAANPHHTPDETKLTQDNFIVFDFGFTGQDGYKSDMTRTVFFGTPTPEQIEMYETVRKAQQAVTDYLQEAFRENPEAKIPAKDIDKIARDIVEGAGYDSEAFCHGLGHGIGLYTHEEPFLNQTSKYVVSAGMVFSNEPGIYISGDQGVRIEDLIAVHPDGKVEVLMNSPRELRVISA